MEFSGDLAAIQQRLARCQDLVARRAAVLEALDAGAGERVVELGCGSGLYLREIGLAVGASGSVLGVDLSADQVAAAREHCRGLDHVRVEVGDLLGLAAGDGAADAVVSVQVLEYVADVDAALADVGRIVRPGGRFVNLATNWGSLFWSGGDAELTRLVLAAWEDHAPHPNLPVALPGLLRAHGFGGVSQRPVTIVNRHCHPNTFSWGAAALMAAFARNCGALDDDQADAWVRSLRNADAAGLHFLSVVPILTVATRLSRGSL